ncbi:MAG: pyridoxamine 5'-phosphate oxidase family protein [Oscillospiraceae bacterium]|nr:pyridoxamine 5'-phosphate oxidase family protein [Oscillospiraceae bacterium]
MFREMRRKNQQLPQEEALEILKKATSGVLAVLGDEGYPYAVPLSYVYSEGKLYFHCAASGHKLDAVRNCDKASFCVISEDNVIPEKYTTAFRSVIAFGRVKELAGEELQTAMRTLANKYSPDESEESFQKEMSSSMCHLCVLALEIEHLSGKEGRELMMKRRS